MIDFFSFLAEHHYQFEQIAKEISLLQNLIGVMQNPAYHGEGDVFAHTKMVCDIVKNLPEWKFLSDEKKGILYTACLFHDIGKIVSTKMVEGQWVSYGHTKVGEKYFRRLAYQESIGKFSFLQREQIASLIRFHGLPPLFYEKENIERQLITASFCVDMELLYLLSKADALGRICKEKELLLDKINYFYEYCTELGCFQTKYPFSNYYTKYQYFYGNPVWHGDELFDCTKFDVIILSGLPLSGKDTFLEEKLSDYPVISLDAIRQRQKLPPNDTGIAAAQAKQMAKEYLRKETSFVWNATNLHFDIRQKLCRLCFRYGARAQLVYIEAPYRKLLERNQTRKRNIPSKVLEKMICSMDMVQCYEGYHVHYYVTENN